MKAASLLPHITSVPQTLSIPDPHLRLMKHSIPCMWSGLGYGGKEGLGSLGRNGAQPQQGLSMRSPEGGNVRWGRPERQGGLRGWATVLATDVGAGSQWMTGGGGGGGSCSHRLLVAMWRTLLTGGVTSNTLAKSPIDS
ncbi:unnamed protein product [Arctogadus glacialis]